MSSRSGRVGVVVVLAALGCADDPAVDELAELPSSGHVMRLRGAGATFSAPVYRAWARHYDAADDVRVRFDLSGSPQGVEAITARKVDFGASDIPLDAEQLAGAGLVQFPAVIGAVVPVVNLPEVGPGELRLTPDLLAGIFLGRVARWDDPALVAANPGVKLPEREIVVVHRADPSGTSWIFTRYLSEISDEWRARAGYGASVEWPAGVGANGGEELSEFVGQFRYTVGFLEVSQALGEDRAWVGIVDDDGAVVEPSIGNIEAATSAGLWFADGGVRFWPSADPGSGWPIVGASYVLMPGEHTDAARIHALLDFFHWGETEGAPLARDLSHVPLPAERIAEVEAAWTDRVRAGGEPIWTPPTGSGAPEETP